jgi:transcriptional regulator with XRE-family HTH domain
MDQVIAKQFGKALVFLLEKEGWGAQARLAREKDIDRGYLNAIIQGRKTGSEHVRGQIADYFHMPYEEMLALGRRLLEAPDRGGMETWSRQERRGVTDALDKSVSLKSVDAGGAHDSPRISHTIQKAIVILESDTEYRYRLADLIDTFHRELIARKESAVLRVELEDMKERIVLLEKKLADDQKDTGN